MYSLLADVTAVVHAAFVAFVVGAQALVLIGWAAGWTWTRNAIFRTLHAAAIAIVVLKAWLDIPCALTVLENEFRARSGLQAYEQTFIGYWIGRLLYYEAPAWVFTMAYTLFGALVLATLLAYPPRRGVSNSTRRQVQ
jgi:hypothetical protein